MGLLLVFNCYQSQIFQITLCQRLNWVLQPCVFQSHPFNYTLSRHLSGPLCLRITGLTLNRHQRVQSPSLKVKPFQREPLWNGTRFPVVMLAGNIVKESRAHFNNGLPFEPHQNHNCVFNHLWVAKLALQDSTECPYIRKCQLFCDKAVPFFFSKNRGVLMTTFLVVWSSAMLRL